MALIGWMTYAALRHIERRESRKNQETART
jgi:hypothetical protein